MEEVYSPPKCITPSRFAAAVAGGMTMAVYTIRLRGHVDAAWFDALDGLEASYEPTGETVLTGSLADQAALFGVLARVRDLGVPLLSVTEVTEREGIANCPSK
jgi:hypothetical protein